LSVSIGASRNPAQPPSRGWPANSSHKVGRDGLGRLHRSPRLDGRVSAGRTRAGAAPPATRDKPLATRLTTLLFQFCSYPASRASESIARIGNPRSTVKLD
jgi:hypothetical protein